MNDRDNIIAALEAMCPAPKGFRWQHTGDRIEQQHEINILPKDREKATASVKDQKVLAECHVQCVSQFRIMKDDS